MLPVFPIRLLLLAVPVAIAAVLIGIAAGKGTNLFRRQGVAWLLTAVMVAAAIGIGYGKAPFNQPAHGPDLPSQTVPPAADAYDPYMASYVWDNANVLSGQTEQVLGQRSQRLDDRYGVVVGVVTCNYGGDDLGGYVLECAEDMGLGGYDMIVALDIIGDNYWLLQGDKLTRDFTNDDCTNYAYDYMEDFFVRGMYDDAVLGLTEALEVWYGNYYG